MIEYYGNEIPIRLNELKSKLVKENVDEYIYYDYQYCHTIEEFIGSKKLDEIIENEEESTT